MKFLNDASGNVAMTTALIAVPLLLAAGSALDYSGLSRKESAMQNAADAAVLFVAQDSLAKGDAALEQEIREHLKVHLSAEQYQEIKNLQVIRTNSNNGLEVKISAEHPTNILGIAGFPTLEYSPVSKVQLNGKRFEIAMVLDSTGSMASDGKMTALKDSASSFINQVIDLNTHEEKVKIGIVPFAQYVNVGIHNKNQFWLDAPSTKTENICSTKAPVISSSGCSDQTFYDDGVPYQRNICTNITYGDPVETCEDRTTEWKGCVGSRVYPLNIQDRSYGTRVPGLVNVSCSSELRPLTSSRSNLLNAISNLNPSGSTYIPAGLTWGFRTLTSAAPISGGKTTIEAENTNTQKMLILMSDGENVSSVNSSNHTLHNGSDVDEANDITLETCNEIKDNDILLYTIGFGDAISSDTETMLANCSTDGISYYRAKDSQKLADAFDDIAAEITVMYLSK